MKRALLPLAVSLTLALAAPAGAAAVRVGSGHASALAAADGLGYLVTDAGRGHGPFVLARSGGRGSEVLRRFGNGDDVFPDVAASPAGRVHLVWGRSVSGGEAYELAVGADAPEPFGAGTGPARLFVGPEGPVLAFPNRDGNVMLGEQQLTADAPFRRHLPLDHEQGLVLDMAQTPDVTELRVLGAEAPRAPVAVAGHRRTLTGTLTVAAGRVYVAYTKLGRAYLASADLEPGARWSTRRLPGRTRGGAAVARSRGRIVVAYARRGEIYVHDGRLRRITRSPQNDGDVLAAADPGTGTLYLAWTRRSRDGRESAFVTRR